MLGHTGEEVADAVSRVKEVGNLMSDISCDSLPVLRTYGALIRTTAAALITGWQEHGSSHESPRPSISTFDPHEFGSLDVLQGFDFDAFFAPGACGFDGDWDADVLDSHV